MSGIGGCLDREACRVHHDLAGGAITAAGATQNMQRTPAAACSKNFEPLTRGRTIQRVSLCITPVRMSAKGSTAVASIVECERLGRVASGHSSTPERTAISQPFANIRGPLTETAWSNGSHYR